MPFFSSIRFYFFFIFIFILFGNPSWCQVNPEFAIDSLVSSSDSLYKADKIEDADRLFFQATEYYKSENDWENWIKVMTLIRFRYIKYRSYSDLSNVLEKHEKDIPQDQAFIKVKYLFLKGYNYSRLLNYGKTIIEYKKSLKLLESLSELDAEAKGYFFTLYKNLSLNYSKLGDQKSALKFGDFAIKFCLENDLQNKLCGLYINKGLFHYYSNQYEEALYEYSKSLENCNSEESKSYIHLQIASLLLEQNKLEDANIYLDSVRLLNGQNDSDYSVVQSNYLIKTGNFKQGEKEIKKAFELIAASKNFKELIKELTKHSILLFDKKEKEQAVSYAHKALCLFYTGLDSTDVRMRPIDNNTIPYTYVIEALNIKAKYFRDKFLETQDEFSLGEATFYYNLLLSHFDKLKSKYYSSTSQYRMGAYSQEIYSEVIKFYVDQYKVSQKETDFENAFSLGQRANSFVLRNAVSDRKGLEMAGVSQDSLEQYLFLASKASTDNKEDTTTNGAEVLLEFDAYKESLLSNYPSYGKYDREEEVTVAEIQSTLDENSILIKYYYFNEILTVFGITKESAFAENLPFPNLMDSLVNSNLEIISQNQSNDSLANMYLTNSKKVYDLVLGNLLEKYDLNDIIDHLIVIPDGPLKKVSFNALSINDSDDWNDPKSFLIGKYAVSYLYYCSQLKNADKSYESKDGFIGFGIEYEDDFLKEIIGDYMSSFKDGEINTRAISLSPLKYADDEVITTAEILDGIPFINSEVTPSHVYATINNYDVVHFSAHAFVDEEDYLNSFVVLNKDDGENYQLKYSDILNLDIDSEMVVLSACQTGSGKSVVGEGLMSLSRAFVQSGSDAAVGAYWNAPDYATKELMALFYSNLKEGMPKSKAIQQAQIEYLTNDNISSPTIRSPFFWASWAVYGDDQPLRMSKSFFDFSSWSSYLLLGIVALLIFLLMKFLLRKK